MELDRQAIERRDFPIARRGYETAAVDAHLRALASEFEELQRAASGGAESSLASAAGSQVQTIVEAAEKAAAEIERQAQESAARVRQEAEQDAERTRNDAIDKARVQVAAVSAVAAKLLQRVGSMDGEVGALMQTLRTGADRLTGDLAAVEKGMDELYGAASGSGPAPPAESAKAAQPSGGEASAAAGATPPPAAPTADPAPATEEGAARATTGQQAAGTGDVDGARLIALNMALNGESRDDTDRYLAENFQLPDRAKLVEEVYAAIEA